MRNNLLRDKKGWTASDFVIATLIFSGGIGLIVLMVGALANEYDNQNVINEDFANQFDKFSEDTSRATEMWNATTSEGGLSLIGTTELLFFSTFRVISLIFTGVVSTGQQMAGFGEFFGIPSEVSGIFLILLFSILTVTIVFIILSSVRSGRDL